MTFFERVYWTSLVVCTICFHRNEMCVTAFDISPNSVYQQQELHVLVTVSLFMDLTITYKYQAPISNDIKQGWAKCGPRIPFVRPADSSKKKIQCAVL